MCVYTCVCVWGGGIITETVVSHLYGPSYNGSPDYMEPFYLIIMIFIVVLMCIKWNFLYKGGKKLKIFMNTQYTITIYAESET